MTYTSFVLPVQTVTPPLHAAEEQLEHEFTAPVVAVVRLLVDARGSTERGARRAHARPARAELPGNTRVAARTAVVHVGGEARTDRGRRAALETTIRGAGGAHGVVVIRHVGRDGGGPDGDLVHVRGVPGWEVTDRYLWFRGTLGQTGQEGQRPKDQQNNRYQNEVNAR